MVIHICDDKNKEKGKRCNLTCHRSIFSPCKFETLKNSQLHGYDDPSFELLRCVNLHRDVHIYIYITIDRANEQIKGGTSRSPLHSSHSIFFAAVCLVDAVPRENAIGIHPCRVLVRGGKDGKMAKTPLDFSSH